ncbi:MAG TPA: succinylglutamate desuccinylase/aspartoacylase family protein [Kribbella sp.]|nr:succinylglutamate desuccinylase/aspartoacylase family protein [Kribbella sp.]
MTTVVAGQLSRMQPGEVGRGLLDAGTLASGNGIGIPYLVARGRGDGPCLWVNAAVHGDESQAAITAAEFFHRARRETLLGDVVVTPVANPSAFDQRRKHSPYDGVDLDQSFPGRRDFLGTQQLAARLFDEIEPVADVVVNVHTMGPFLEAVSYAVYKLPPDGQDEKALLSRIALLDPRVACRMDVSGAGELPGHIEGALDYQLTLRGKQAFMLEAGASGSVDRATVDRATSGLLRLGRAVGTIDGPPVETPSSICRATRRTHVTSTAGGFFHAAVRPGTTLAAGQPLGTIYNVFGDVAEIVTMSGPCLVIGVRQDPAVHSGDRVGFVATEWDEVSLAGSAG